MNKKTRNVLIVLALLVVSAIVITSLSAPGVDYPSGSHIEVPTYGTLSCLPHNEDIRVPEGNNNWETFSSKIFTCGTFTGQHLPQKCAVRFKMPDENEVPSIFKVIESCLIYTVCSPGSVCKSGMTGAKANEMKCVRKVPLTGGEEVAYGEHIDIIDLRQGDTVIVNYKELSPWGSIKLVNRGKMAVYIEPWTIWRHDIFDQATGKEIANSVDCKISSRTQEIKYAVKSFTGKLPLEESPVINADSLQNRNAVLTYITQFVTTPPQFHLFEDDTKYCTNRKIYRVAEVETNLGTYKVANVIYNDAIDEVDCCNKGDCNIHEACEDFECVPIPRDEKCSVWKPCSLPVWTPKASKLMVRQECNPDTNTCEVKEITVKCASSSDCPVGNICEMFVDDPSKNYCRSFSAQDTCGNGICEESLGETIINCPKDCKMIQPPIDLTPFFIVAGIIVILVFMVAIALIIGRNKK